MLTCIAYKYEQMHGMSNKNDVMRLGERPRSLEGKPNIKLSKI